MKKDRSLISSILYILTEAVLVIYSFVVIFPLLWTVYTSFKTSQEFFKNPWALPKALSAENYINALKRGSLGIYFFNSIFAVAVSIIAATILCIAASYVLARYKFPFSTTLKNLFLGYLFVPQMFVLVPLFLLVNNIKLYGTRSSLILVYILVSLPFTIYVLIPFFKSLPRDYEDSAMIDGCTYFGILFRIMTPLAKPGIITVSIFNFLWLWNDYTFALIFISKERYNTITLGLARLMEIQRYATDWGALFAGLVIVMLPTLIFYIALQNKLTSGLTLGGVKG